MKTNKKGTFCSTEIDGLRLISSNKNEVLRLIPDSYVHLFQSCSYEPAALLYTAYECYENKAPLENEDIRNDKKSLMEAV